MKIIEQIKGGALTLALFLIYFLILTGVILFKLPFYSPEVSDGIRVVNLIPFQGSYDADGFIVWREIAQNILLFVPFGIYVCMLKGNWPLWKKIIAIIGLTVTFETAQFVFALGRSDVTDVLDNTAGGLIGIVGYMIMFKIFRGRTNAVMNILALAATVCVVWRFSYLFYLSHFAMRVMPLQ